MKNSKTILNVVFAGLVTFGVSACSDVTQTLTQTKAAPDEFTVYTRAPLTMPRDYGLRPPTDGSEQDGSLAADAQEAARRVLLSNNKSQISVQAATPGTTALLTAAGAQNAQPGIRKTINSETTAFADDDETFVQTLMFWYDAPIGTGVDASVETKRIQESQALGKPISDGSSNSQIIETKSNSLLSGFFSGWFD